VLTVMRLLAASTLITSTLSSSPTCSNTGYTRK
jgi:hypothetical protein